MSKRNKRYPYTWENANKIFVIHFKKLSTQIIGLKNLVQGRKWELFLKTV